MGAPHPPLSKLVSSLSVVAIVALVATPTAAERLSHWTNYTDVREVTALAASGDSLWVASRGGLVRLDPWDTVGERRFTNADGLGGNDLRFVTVDSQGTLWTGGTNGRLSHRRSDARWDTYRFENDNGIPIALNAAAPGPDGFLWIASDVGVHKFDTQRHGGEIKETYTRIGEWPDGAAVRDIMVRDGLLWAVGDAGVARARLDDPFLLDRSHWQTWTGISALSTVTVHVGSTYAGGTGGLFVLADVSLGEPVGDSVWRRVPLAPGVTIVRDLHSDGDTLWIASPSGLVWYGASNAGIDDIPGATASRFVSVTGAGDGTLWVGEQGMGLWQRGGGWSRIELAGPLDNAFTDIAVGEDGRVWCMHAGYGADFLSEGHWTKLPFFEAGPSFPGTSVAVAPNGEIWLGSWGTGAWRVNPSAPLSDTGHTHYDTLNSTLRGVSAGGGQSTNYVVLLDVSVDPLGRVWFANAFADLGPALVFTDQGCWGRFDSTDGLVSAQPTALWAEPDRVLIGTADAGLVELTYAEPLCSGGEPVPQRGHVREWTTKDFLPSDNVRAVLIDRADSVWVGTNVGLARYASDRRRFFDIALPSEAGLTINALAADAANRIWVGTSLGLVVIAGDGDMAYYNSTNSGLAGDAVEAIAMDNRRGTAWIATETGLSQTRTALPPADAVDEVIAYPNPFDLSSSTSGGVQFNAPFGSRIFIFTVDGRPVADLDASVGWDGRGDQGELVASGVYLFVVRGPDGEHGHGKIAVRRRP
ncbi:MAG: hypothetical protein AB1792_00930 [Candidatus Zixiibacteriota bacterium]